MATKEKSDIRNLKRDMEKEIQTAGFRCCWRKT